MKRDEYNKMVHEKELKSLAEIIKKIQRGWFWIASIRMDKDLVGNGYRVTMFLRERGEK